MLLVVKLIIETLRIKMYSGMAKTRKEPRVENASHNNICATINPTHVLCVDVLELLGKLKKTPAQNSITYE